MSAVCCSDWSQSLLLSGFDFELSFRFLPLLGVAELNLLPLPVAAPCRLELAPDQPPLQLVQSIVLKPAGRVKMVVRRR